MSRAIVVGCGNVGSCTAQTVANQNLYDEIVLVDRRRARAEAEAADLSTALPRLGARTKVCAGSVDDSANADVVVLCASAPARLGQTRNEMFVKNVNVIKDIVMSVEDAGFTGCYLVVSNPVDLITWYLVDSLGISSARVVGTGTLLDSMRLEDAIKKQLGDCSVSAFAYGEHGEGLVVDWAQTSVDGNPVPRAIRESLRRSTIDLAYEIVKGKGSTSYGIAMAISVILRAMQSASDTVLPLSVPALGAFGIDDIALSLPVSFEGSGVPRVIERSLDSDTARALLLQAKEMREFYRSALSTNEMQG